MRFPFAREISPAIRAAREAGGTGIARAFGLENLLGRWVGATPELRLSFAASPTARSWVETFAQKKYAQPKNFDLQASAQALESELHLDRDVLIRSIDEPISRLILEYQKKSRGQMQADAVTRQVLENIRLRKNKQGHNLAENHFANYKTLSEDLLLEEAGITLRRGQRHPIDVVNQIADIYHQSLKTLGKRMVELQMIPEEVMQDPQWFNRYLPQEANLMALRNDPATVLNLVTTVMERRKAESVVRKRSYVEKGKASIEQFIAATEARIKKIREEIQTSTEKSIQQKNLRIEKTNAAIQKLEGQKEKLRQQIDKQVKVIEERIKRKGDPITEMESVQMQRWEDQIKNYDRRLEKLRKINDKRIKSLERMAARQTKKLDKEQALRIQKAERRIKKWQKRREKQLARKMERQAAREERLAQAEAFDPRQWASNWLYHVEHGEYDTTGTSRMYIGRAGAQKRRGLLIPDDMLAEFEPFLVNNIRDLAARYIHDIMPRIKLAEKFPDDQSFVKLKEAIHQDYQNLRTDPTVDIRDRVKLAREESRVLEDIDILRDRFLGKDRMPTNPYSLLQRVSTSILKLNTMTSLGRVALGSIPDLARSVARYGAPRVMEVMSGTLNASELWKLSKEELQTLIGIHELQLQHRYHESSDVITGVQPLNRLERMIDKASERFGRITGLSYWNQAGIERVALLACDLILGTARKIALKQPLDRLELVKIAEAGLDQAALERIWKQFDKYGKEKNHVWFPNMAKWDDQQAARLFQIAIKREVETVWTIPGIGDRPVWTSYRLGRHLGQFKSFSFTIVQSALLSGLQYSDRAAMEGMALSLFLGGSLYALYEILEGRKPDLSPGRLTIEAMDRSGVLGWLMDVDAILERASEGRIGLSPLLGGPVRSKYTSRDIFALLGGKTAGTIQDIFAITGAVASNNWSAADVKSMRRLIPYQNVFYLKWLFDGLERGYANLVGAEESSPK